MMVGVGGGFLSAAFLEIWLNYFLNIEFSFDFVSVKRIGVLDNPIVNSKILPIENLI